jgi:hypothetical protein
MSRRTMSPMVRSGWQDLRQELRGHADDIAAEGAATTASLAKEAPPRTY